MKEKKQEETWVTTLDNPFDPFKDFTNWKRYDEDHGYHTTSLLCRYLHVPEDAGHDLYWSCVEDAVDIIVGFNFTGNYRKVVNKNPNNE